MVSRRLDPQNSRFEPDPLFVALLGRARAADGEAIEELCARFYPIVQRKVHGELDHDLRHQRPWLSARFSTGDVVQEVFRSVITDLRSFDGHNEGAFVGYLTMLVHNRLIDSIRFHQADCRDGRRLLVEAGSLSLPDDGVDPSDAAALEEEVERYRSAVATLSERDQLIIRARSENDSSFDEIAERFGFGSAATARRAFYAAQATLLVRLGSTRS